MSEPTYTKEDLALFVDLDNAAVRSGSRPCLIGAGLIQLGVDCQWKLRLARRTNDWDFAVRVDSLERFEAMKRELSSSGGGFNETSVPHRFLHRAGGTLDLVPYGGIEDPPGTLVWPDGSRMNLAGMDVLDRHHELVRLEQVELLTASIPAVLGLKLLAYLDRRPEIVRDIQDVHALLEGAQEMVPEDRVLAEGLERLHSDEVGYGEIGAYILGRDVGRIFPVAVLEPVHALLDALGTDRDRTLGDIRLTARPPEPERVIERFRAFALGLLDR